MEFLARLVVGQLSVRRKIDIMQVVRVFLSYIPPNRFTSARGKLPVAIYRFWNRAQL